MPSRPLPLFPYQIEGARWLASKRAGCLFDEMGIGKSAQAIKACDLVGARSVLVICRAVARENWRREFEKFSSQERACRTIYGRDDAAHLDGGIVICSYESLPHVLNNYPGNFDCVVIDESHYVKEPTSLRTRNVLGKVGAIHRGSQTFLLTGTPTPNHAGELWTTLYTLGRTRLNYEQFVEKFCTYRDTSFGRQITGSVIEPDKIAEIRGMLAPICLRRTKEDVNLELPPIFYSDPILVKPGKFELMSCRCFCNYVLPVDRTKDLEEILERELGVINGITDGGFTDEAMRALEANAKNIMTLRRYNSMQKVDPVIDLVSEELDSKAYKKIVIFAIHRDTLVVLQQKLSKKYGAVLIFGGTKPSRMQDRIDAFQNTAKCRIFIAQLHCAGTSLTLTASDQVLFVDLDWVPGNNHQAAARCHRIGQTKPVTVRSIALEHSIDQHISKILSRKTRELAVLMDGAMSAPITINQIL
jgi:SWI/SNF-related matrix-associated actin-dependent regulator 1 of chromatin subfamily A